MRERREHERRDDEENRHHRAGVRTGRRRFHVLITMSATVVETAARRIRGEQASRARALLTAAVVGTAAGVLTYRLLRSAGEDA